MSRSEKRNEEKTGVSRMADISIEEVEALRERVRQLEQEQIGRIKAERDLQDSEARYRILVETMNEGLGVQDERGNVVYLNNKLSKMLGYDRKEMVGKPSADFVSEEYKPLFASEMSSDVKGEREPREIVLQGKGNIKVSAIISPMAIWGQDGEYRGSFAVFTDVTDRKKAEQDLELERNLLRTMMDSIPDYAYIKDTEGRFLTTNTSHLRVLGVGNVADIVGKTDFDFFPRELAEQYAANEKLILSSGTALLNKVEQVVTAQGDVIWVMTFKAPLRDANGSVVGIVGVSRDITELRMAERALRESQDRLRLILENSNDVAYKLDLRAYEFEYVSPSVRQRFGFTSSEIIGMGAKRCLIRIHPEDRKRFLAHIRTLRAPADEARIGQRPTVIEYRFMNRYGEYRWIAQSSTVLRADDGQPVAEVGTIRDVTDGKHAEEALRAASRIEATATLAGGIAHDFNNLMVGVLGNAELLQMRFGDDSDTMRMLDTIAKSAQQAGELAQQMLAFARGGKYQPKIVSLNEVINDVMQLERRSVPPQIRVDRNLDEGLWTVKADPVQMSQVIMNLSINAAEAIDGEGRIEISTRNVVVDERFAKRHPGLNPGMYVCLSVEDTGKGMPPETLSRVFEPFYTTKFQGRGLGLAAAYGIVKNHGGHIAVMSEVGKGSIFTVYIPVSTGEVSLAKKSVPQRVTERETILVVDDEPVVIEVTQQILERLGYHVLCAKNGQEAVDIAHSYEGEIHAAVLDMGMPVMGGAQAFPHLLRERPNIKVLISSGYELDPSAQSLLDAGASAFIQKPFRANALATSLRKAIRGEFATELG